MSASVAEKDYILGTHDAELARLGLQHRVWRPVVLECWRNAGITAGMRVADFGAGPGFATLDLAEIVGAQGHVLAIERSARYADAARAACTLRGLPQVQVREADLMTDTIDATGFDAAWCRWVACFVPEPQKLVQAMADSLRTGGVAIFHEYSDYRSWRLAPQSLPLESFVDEVMQSWRDSGGEPDIALQLPAMMEAAGLKIRSVTPRIFTISPDSYIWQWPKAFIQNNLERLQSLGRVSAEWAADVQQAMDDAERNPSSFMTTPLVLEIVAEKL